MDFRWHQIILLFGYQSVILQFDNQLNDEIELPLKLIRTSRKFYITNVAFLNASGHQESSFFKVNQKTGVSIFLNLK